MKITVIYGTNRTEKSSTYNIARQFTAELADGDVVTEFHLQRDMPVFCTGCLTCLSDSTKCPHYKYIQPIEEAMQNADLIIFTAPVYLLHVPGQVKALLDHFGFQWMAHKPKDVYFHKQALVISTGARIGMRQTVRDVKNSLDWWGVGRIYRFKKTVGMEGWRELSEKKKAKFTEEIKQTSRKIRRETGAKPRLKVKMIFYLMRFAQKKFWSDEPQAVYWKENGWFAEKKTMENIMKLTVLVDNNTFIDKYFYGEPGLCFYIEDGTEKILLDTGYSDLFIRNAKKLGIDLSALTKIVISHGHDDHTGGLPHLLERFDTSSFEVITHPDTFAEKRRGDLLTGSPVSEETMREKTRLLLSKDPIKISDHITFLGEIPITQEFEQRPKMDTRKTLEGYVPDYILEDSALFYEMDAGIYIITGCSHAGICNMCAYAKELSKKPILGIIGGWHMKKVDERAKKTISYMKNEGISEMYPCHCTSFAVKAAVHQMIPVHEVGVGLKVEW